MSFEAMRDRINYFGGGNRQDRMLDTKQASLAYAIKNSYQAAEMMEYPTFSKTERGLINPVIQNESYDTKLLSISHDANYGVGTIFKWMNTDSYWLIYLEDRTELGYFKGNIRRCDYKVQWVSGDREVLETPIAIIGPTTPTLRTSSSMQAKVAQDFPNQVVIVMVPDNEQNQLYFNRYQKFLLKGTTYIIETLDNISMPGIIKLHATEHYNNKVEDDVEEDLMNKWNIGPIIEETSTEYMIEGPNIIKPQYRQEYTAVTSGGVWTVLENEGKGGAANLIPVKFVEDTNQQTIHIYWDAYARGNFTLVYTVGEHRYMKNIHVESLM